MKKMEAANEGDGGCQGRRWRLPRKEMEAAKEEDGDCQGRRWRLPKKKMEAAKEGDGGCQWRRWRLPMKEMEAASEGDGGCQWRSRRSPMNEARRPIYLSSYNWLSMWPIRRDWWENQLTHVHEDRSIWARVSGVSAQLIDQRFRPYPTPPVTPTGGLRVKMFPKRRMTQRGGIESGWRGAAGGRGQTPISYSWWVSLYTPPPPHLSQVWWIAVMDEITLNFRQGQEQGPPPPNVRVREGGGDKNKY